MVQNGVLSVKAAAVYLGGGFSLSIINGFAALMVPGCKQPGYVRFGRGGVLVTCFFQILYSDFKPRMPCQK